MDSVRGPLIVTCLKLYVGPSAVIQSGLLKLAMMNDCNDSAGRYFDLSATTYESC